MEVEDMRRGIPERIKNVRQTVKQRVYGFSLQKSTSMKELYIGKR